MTDSLQIEKMTLEEKLERMEKLWNQLCRNEADVPVPEWHKEILDERERMIAEGKAKFSAWEDAKKRLSRQRK
jgi:hypothetical protein